MPECMICHRPSTTAANDAGDHVVCARCEESHARLLDDDEDPDGRAEARHLTILAIDIDD